MASFIYNKAKLALVTGVIDLDSHTFYAALFASSHVPAATDQYYTSLTNEVANGSGYTTGGAAIGSITVTESSGTVTLDGSDVTWTSSTITAMYAVVYDYTNANKDLLCLIDFLENTACSGGYFTIQWASGGIITLV